MEQYIGRRIKALINNPINFLEEASVYAQGKWAEIVEEPKILPTDEELLQEAKKRYPVGTIFKVAHAPKIKCKILSHEKYEKTIVYNPNGLHINFLCEYINKSEDNLEGASVYAQGKWAEIVEEPKILPTDEELLEYANKNYVVGTKFISSIIKSDKKKERECIYYNDSQSTFGWKISTYNGERSVHCNEGMNISGGVCSNPTIYTDTHGWCKITHNVSNESKEGINFSFKIREYYYFESYRNKYPNIAKCNKIDNMHFISNDWIMCNNIICTGNGTWHLEDIHNVRKITTDEYNKYIKKNNKKKDKKEEFENYIPTFPEPSFQYVEYTDDQPILIQQNKRKNKILVIN